MSIIPDYRTNKNYVACIVNISKCAAAIQLAIVEENIPDIFMYINRMSELNKSLNDIVIGIVTNIEN